MEQRISRWAPVALAVIVVVGVAARQQAPPRVGFINLPAIMEQTPGYDEARAVYQTDVDGYSQDIARLQTTFDSAVQDYRRQQVVLSPTARDGKESELTQMQQALTQRQQELQQQALNRERELLAPLEQRVQSVIEGLRAERNLAIMFDVGSEYSNIVAADGALDMSVLVVERLRAQE